MRLIKTNINPTCAGVGNPCTIDSKYISYRYACDGCFRPGYELGVFLVVGGQQV